MPIPSIRPELKEQILLALESTSRILDLNLCFYTYAYRDLIPYELQIHAHPVCMHIKEMNEEKCVDYCGQGIPQKIFKFEKGKVDKCPFGCSQIIIPVFCDDHPFGVIFVGVFRQQNSPPPNAGIRVARSLEWIEDRKSIVVMLAKYLEILLSRSSEQPKRTIRSEILKFVLENLSRPIKLRELANCINKSPSRTSHLVRENFGCSFQHLVVDMRINQAMALLKQTNYSIAQIAGDLGFSDQSHFTHTFKKRRSVTPLAYRKGSSI